MEPMQSTPPAAGESLVEYVRTQRPNAGVIFGVLTMLLLALTAFMALKAFRTPGEPDKSADKASPENPFDPERLDPVKPVPGVNLKRDDYTSGMIGTLLAALITGTAAGFLLAGIPPQGEAAQRTEARVFLLAIGGLLGAAVIVFGMWYFYRWSDSLTEWLDKGQVKEALWVLIPLLMIVAGAGLVLVAVQPARAEERNNTTLRRLVYGSNFALTALLMVVALVVANVLFSLKVPNKLDTTATGFYSISDTTKNLLGRLDQPVTAYAVLPETADRKVNDIRQLLLACQDASDGKFKVKMLSRATNTRDLSTLRGKYPQLDLTLDQRTVEGAVLLTTGEDEKRHAVIPDNEFFEDRGNAFQGESRLFKEVAFLADNQTKPVVYFVQGNGELDIVGGVEATPARSGTRLKAYLEKNYLDIRPLPLIGDAPAVPDDAAVVVVADPRASYPDPAVAALRKYLNNPAKKGKLVFLSGAAPGPDGKMLRTGLEPVLAELNVRLGDKFIYNVPTQQFPRTESIVAMFSKASEENPILQAIAKVSPGMEFQQPRGIDPAAANPAFQATPLMHSQGLTWVEDERLADPQRALQEISGSEKLQDVKQLSNSRRPVAVIVSERGVGRAVVFGTSYFVSDDAARRVQTNPLSFDLFGVSVDWLRDKQTSIAASGIEAKKYSEYTFPPPATVSSARLVWLPLGLGLLTVVGLGAGVWVIRRK